MVNEEFKFDIPVIMTKEEDDNDVDWYTCGVCGCITLMFSTSFFLIALGVYVLSQI